MSQRCEGDDMTAPDKRLAPCPWCGAGTTLFKDNDRSWTGNKWSTPISVSIQHWCEPIAGQPSRMIERVGKDEESAVAIWNMRAPVGNPALD